MFWGSQGENGIMSSTTTIDNAIPRAGIIKRAARLGAEIKN
ncbi:TauD/TfdA family dioxygenase, partial [Campylobacter jejuni]